MPGRWLPETLPEITNSLDHLRPPCRLFRIRSMGGHPSSKRPGRSLLERRPLDGIQIPCSDPADDPLNFSDVSWPADQIPSKGLPRVIVASPFSFVVFRSAKVMRLLRSKRRHGVNRCRKSNAIGREPSGTSRLYRQADACRSPVVSLITAGEHWQSQWHATHQ